MEGIQLQVQLITGRSLGQGTGKEKGKFSTSYRQSTSICELDPADFIELNLKESENIFIETAFGSIVVKPIISKQAPHRGIIFVPYGPWVNRVTDYNTEGSGMPTLKGITANISATKKPISKV